MGWPCTALDGVARPGSRGQLAVAASQPLTDGPRLDTVLEGPFYRREGGPRDEPHRCTEQWLCRPVSPAFSARSLCRNQLGCRAPAAGAWSKPSRRPRAGDLRQSAGCTRRAGCGLVRRDDNHGQPERALQSEAGRQPAELPTPFGNVTRSRTGGAGEEKAEFAQESETTANRRPL